MLNDDKNEKQLSDEVKAFAKLYSEFEAKREEWEEKDYVEELIAKGHPETAEN